MKEPGPYSLFSRISAILMMLALLWLSISIPFVFRAQQADQHHISANASPFAGAEEDSTNPLTGTEEKAPNSPTITEEYLHEYDRLSCFFTGLSNSHFHANDDTYVAYHGELLVPPPNAL